ncbi:MAG: hypothetical protein ABL949_05990 [Fimbriimonadaceae bacterium]
MASIAALSDAEFIPDSLSFNSVSMEGITGHNQVTDAYLVYLARAHGLTLATFDKSLKARYPEVHLIL